MRSLQMVDDAMGNTTDIIEPPESSLVIALEPATPRSITPPAGARLVLFNATGPYWARIGGPATLPVTDILDGSAPELMPTGRALAAGQTIGLVAVASCLVNLTFYG